MFMIYVHADFWDVAPCRSCVNRRFGGTCRLHLLTQELHSGTSQKTTFFKKQNVERLSNILFGPYSIFRRLSTFLLRPFLLHASFLFVYFVFCFLFYLCITLFCRLLSPVVSILSCLCLFIFFLFLSINLLSLNS
jgi:hypothetical protein